MSKHTHGGSVGGSLAELILEGIESLKGRMDILESRMELVEDRVEAARHDMVGLKHLIGPVVALAFERQNGRAGHPADEYEDVDDGEDDLEIT